MTNYLLNYLAVYAQLHHPSQLVVWILSFDSNSTTLDSLFLRRSRWLCNAFEAISVCDSALETAIPISCCACLLLNTSGTFWIPLVAVNLRKLFGGNKLWILRMIIWNFPFMRRLPNIIRVKVVTQDAPKLQPLLNTFLAKTYFEGCQIRYNLVLLSASSVLPHSFQWPFPTFLPGWKGFARNERYGKSGNEI